MVTTELTSRHTVPDLHSHHSIGTGHIIMVHARTQEWAIDQQVHQEAPREVAIWEAEDDKFYIFRKKVLRKFGNTKKNIYLCTVNTRILTFSIRKNF